MCLRNSLAVFMLSLGLATQAQAALTPPPGFMAPVRVGSDSDCPPVPPPFTQALDFPSKYQGSGAARDQHNEMADQAYKQKSEPITNFEKGLSKQVGRYLKGGHATQLDCAIAWLGEWSEAHALLGKAESHTGAAVRKWALGSIAAAYLRLKFSSSRPLLTRGASISTIEAWLGRVADQVVLEWGDAPDKNFNNHEYWASWAVMATAVALDRQDLFDWSVENYRRAAAQIDAEGYLANELARETRALQYHNYSLPPLTMIAAFAKANGLDLAQENDAALKRLAARTLAGIDDANIFKAKTGKKQKTDGLDDPSKFSWLEPYCWLYVCDRALKRRLESYRPINTYRLGGDITALFAHTVIDAGETRLDLPSSAVDSVTKQLLTFHAGMPL
ncbi:MAG: mannuronate-specific alginate lyase [Porticoccaceae bacterium]